MIVKAWVVRVDGVPVECHMDIPNQPDLMSGEQAAYEAKSGLLCDVEPSQVTVREQEIVIPD